MQSTTSFHIPIKVCMCPCTEAVGRTITTIVTVASGWLGLMFTSFFILFKNAWVVYLSMYALYNQKKNHKSIFNGKKLKTMKISFYVFQLNSDTWVVLLCRIKLYFYYLSCLPNHCLHSHSCRKSTLQSFSLSLSPFLEVLGLNHKSLFEVKQWINKYINKQ